MCSAAPRRSGRAAVPPPRSVLTRPRRPRELRPTVQKRSKSRYGPKRGARRATGAPSSESRKTPPKASGSAPGAELAHQPGVNKSMNKRWRKRRRLFARARKENHKGRRRLLVIPHAHREQTKAQLLRKGQLNRHTKCRPATTTRNMTGAVTAVASLDGLVYCISNLTDINFIIMDGFGPK